MALKDLLIGVVVVGSVSAIAVPTLSQVRMDAGRQWCNDNYRFIAQASGSYVNDFGGQMWALSWKRGMQAPPGSSVIPGGTFYFDSDYQAQSFQAIGIMRKLSGMNQNMLPVPGGWIPSAVYSHMSLMDYVGLRAPAQYMVCPEDWTRQAYVEGDYRKLPPSGGDGNSSIRPIFSSSYSASVYQWSPSRQTSVVQNGVTRKTAMVTIEGSAVYTDPSSLTSAAWDSWRPQAASDVRFPSSKVFMSDDYARHNGRPRYYAYQTAAQDLLFHDGSVRYYRTDSTNPGWDPYSATNRSNMKLRFTHRKDADFWGGLDNNATSTNFAAGWYRWTRGGLFGWDVPRMSSMVGKLPRSTVIEKELDTNPGTGAW